MEVKTINGRIAVPPAEALVLAGFSRDINAATQTARNRICEGTFPLILTEVLGKKRVLVTDLLTACGVDIDEADTEKNKSKGRKNNLPKEIDE